MHKVLNTLKGELKKYKHENKILTAQNERFKVKVSELEGEAIKCESNFDIEVSVLPTHKCNNCGLSVSFKSHDDKINYICTCGAWGALWLGVLGKGVE